MLSGVKEPDLLEQSGFFYALRVTRRGQTGTVHPGPGGG